MPNKYLETYLNDHLAGSVVALELLEQLQQRHADTPLEEFAAALHAEISADRDELQRVMQRLEIAPSKTRKATGWLTEKLAQVKLYFDGPADKGFHLLETLEVLSLGIEGKRSLWRALAHAVDQLPALASIDFDTLIRRAEDQRSQVEVVRLETGKGLFVQA